MFSYWGRKQQQMHICTDIDRGEEMANEELCGFFYTLLIEIYDNCTNFFPHDFFMICGFRVYFIEFFMIQGFGEDRRFGVDLMCRD